MLKKFTLRNYKNFDGDIAIDFQNIGGYPFSSDCLMDGLISKMLIYGRNATGKTNLGKALFDINITLFGTRLEHEGIFLNADSPEDYACFSYMFQFGESEIIYSYTKCSFNKVREEQLIVDGITIFCFDFTKKEYVYDNLKHIGAETANVDRYIEFIEIFYIAEETGTSEMPFMRWLMNNVALKTDSPVLKLFDYVSRMSLLTISLKDETQKTKDSFFRSLEEESAFEDFKEFLNYMGIECNLVLKKLPDDRSELYFAYQNLIPFYDNASSGTLALFDIYRYFVAAAKEASFLYWDEFDAFFHYEMAENLILYFKKKYSKCQIILTTHNTNLMTNRLMRPDCLFILSRSGKLTALCDATQRELREGHNLEKMYISGEFQIYE